MAVASLKELLQDSVLDLKKISNHVSKFNKYPKLQKTLIKLLTKVWSEDDDSRRILALLCLIKCVKSKPQLIAFCIKTMFVAYVRNCKFVIGSTLAQINFMRRSLIELFSINLDEAYLHGFVYIRQLAIVLRKAVTSHKKEDLQAVHNWQFINSLRLWAEMVASYLSVHNLIQSLIHPLVQLILGTVGLCTGERWIPLRFHCVSMLHTLAGVPTLISDEANQPDGQSLLSNLSVQLLPSAQRLLVPSLSFLLDTFQLVNFNRHCASASRAPLDLRLMLHFSPSHQRETGSLDAIVSWLLDLLIESSALNANSVAFPEFSAPLLNEVKRFLRTCRVRAFTRQFKDLQAKVQEHSDWIKMRRRSIRHLGNAEEIFQFEANLNRLVNAELDERPPFWSFYVRHKQVRSKELAQLTASRKKDTLPDDNSDRLPSTTGASDDEADFDSDKDDSDASYDFDDGITVTHVSKSARKQKNDLTEPASKQKRKMKGSVRTDSKSAPRALDGESESDFDLEAELNEPEETDSRMSDTNDDDKATLQDELTDFELSSSDNEASEDDDYLHSSSGEDIEGRTDLDMLLQSKSKKQSKKKDKIKRTEKENEHLSKKQRVQTKTLKRKLERTKAANGSHQAFGAKRAKLSRYKNARNFSRKQQ